MSTSTDLLHNTLRAAGRRLTPQRRLILQVLQESEEHLDAKALYERVKARDPDVSLATVYRTLVVLKETGLIEEHRLGEEHGHFETVGTNPHFHFTCLSCGQVIEFDSSVVSQVEQELVARNGLRVTHTHLHLSGYCARCQATSSADDSEGI